MSSNTHQAAADAIQLARKGQEPFFDDGPLGDLARDDVVCALPVWVQAKKGWIYLAGNPAWPGLYKIGCTRKGVEKRMASLNRTGIVTEWSPLVFWQVYDAHGLEARAHRQCEAFQHSFEMFQASPQELIARVDAAIEHDRQAIARHLKELLHLPELASLFTVTRFLA